MSFDFPLAEYIDVAIRSVRARKEATEHADKELVIRASLINKMPEEIEIFFNGRQCQCAGGFRVHVGSRVYAPKGRLVGLKEYNRLPAGYGVLPAHGRKDFELLLELPEADARSVLAKGEGVRVVLIVHGLCHKGIYTEIMGPSCEVPGRWEQPSS